ncbi:MAG: glycoside hydrolase family 26 protein [Capsulimonadaceae bacterium]
MPFPYLHAVAAVASLAAASPSHHQSPPIPPRFRTAAQARAWAEQAEGRGDYSGASRAYYIEAGIRNRIGDLQGAQVELRRACRLDTTVQFAIPSSDPPLRGHLARFEPLSGCYIGVRDDFAGQYWGKDSANCEDFAARVGHPVAVALDYEVYGLPFPTNWAIREAHRERAIQIAWEPQDISKVADDRYLNQWAEDAGRSRAPVFLRFGGEMNGFWTSWGRNPAAYKRAFRIVHDVMARHAANVVMVWAPNAIPVTNLDQYYPGDDVVDWVGISLYIVRYYDDDLTRPAWQDSIESFIDPIYAKYAGRKPFCLAEFGITRRSRVEGTNADAFAADRLTDLLESIKVRYPRLKMACFFDRNNLVTAIQGRRLNDYQIAEGSLVLASARQELQDPYFLGCFQQQCSAPVEYLPAVDALPAGYNGSVSTSVSTYCLDPWLQVTRGHTAIHVARPFRFTVPGGSGPLQITVYDNKGRIAGKFRLDAP